MSDYSDYTFDEEELILHQAPAVFYHRSNMMTEMDNKIFKMIFRLSKYVFEGLEFRLFSYKRGHLFIHRTSNIIFTRLLQSHCSHDLAECVLKI